MAQLKKKLLRLDIAIDCCSKFATGLKCLNRHRSKNIWVTRLFFCQNDSLMGESFGNRAACSHSYTFWTMPILIFSLVANFGQQSLYLPWESQWGRDIATSGRNKQKFQLGQSYFYIMRKGWYHQIWIQNNLGIMVSDLT